MCPTHMNSTYWHHIVPQLHIVPDSSTMFLLSSTGEFLRAQNRVVAQTRQGDPLVSRRPYQVPTSSCQHNIPSDTFLGAFKVLSRYLAQYSIHYLSRYWILAVF